MLAVPSLLALGFAPKEAKLNLRAAICSAPRIRQLPDRRPILIATKAMLFIGPDTGTL